MKETGQAVAFLDSTYEEALRLTREARDYLAQQEPADRAKLAPEARLVTSCETMRLTARLTQTMAWLLVQKAVHAGEMSRAEAAENRTSAWAARRSVRSPMPRRSDYLPPRWPSLLLASHALYSRVERLDAMLGADETGQALRLEGPKPLVLDAQALEALVELGKLAAGVDQAVHAGPGRVGLRIDIQAQRCRPALP